MNYIIVDDEPLARRSIERLAENIPQLVLKACFSNTGEVDRYLAVNETDLIFLDINMPGVNGIDFARTVPKSTLLIFTTAYPEYAAESYEVDAIDYLVKPISEERFNKAVNKAVSYRSLLTGTVKDTEPDLNKDHIFIRSEKRFWKINFDDILFIEGLKDYVVIQTINNKFIARMYLKIIQKQLPGRFLRINKSFIVNTDKIDSYDNNDIYIGTYEIGIGNGYRETFISMFRNNGR